MGWARFDDGYIEHDKIVEAGPMAELLDVRGIIACCKRETNGFVSHATLKRISRGIPRVAEKVLRLVEVGRWEPADGGWQIHDFLEFNPSREDRERKRAEARARVRANRERTSDELRRGRELQEKRAAIERCSRCDSKGLIIDPSGAVAECDHTIPFPRAEEA